jgi:hypothetical protein
MKTDNFKMELYENINNYFIINNISKYANSKMYYKLFIAICWWLLSLFLLLFVPANKFFLYYMLFIVLHNFIFF